MNELEHLNQFITAPPILVKRQFSEPAWKFINGIERTLVGEKALRASIRNFLYVNLGPPRSDLSGDKQLQQLRKLAFNKFGHAMMQKYPNCWYWKGQMARLGNTEPWSPLIQGMAKAIKARKTQHYRRDQPENLDFWLASEQPEQDETGQQLQRQEQYNQQQQQQHLSNTQQLYYNQPGQNPFSNDQQLNQFHQQNHRYFEPPNHDHLFF